jgi:hypothetical protein
MMETAVQTEIMTHLTADNCCHILVTIWRTAAMLLSQALYDDQSAYRTPEESRFDSQQVKNIFGIP